LAILHAHARNEDKEEIGLRLRRAFRGDPVRGFTRTTRRDMVPYSLLIVPALSSGDPMSDLVRQYEEGVERTKKALDSLSGKIRIYMPGGEDFKVYAWAYDEKNLILLFRFGNSMRILDSRPEVEPVFIKFEYGGKLKVGTRVHYKTLVWREVDRVDIYISPVGHTPIVLNSDTGTNIDPARAVWIYLNKGASAITRTKIYELRDGSFISGGDRKDIYISPFFEKVAKKHDLPAFVREMLNYN
jgi:hypothetical protein